jgi:hypothetical protein
LSFGDPKIDFIILQADLASPLCAFIQMPKARGLPNLKILVRSRNLRHNFLVGIDSFGFRRKAAAPARGG